MTDEDARGPGPKATEPADPGKSARLPATADLLPSVSAPRGGGAIRSLAEKLTVDAATGTCGMSVTLPFSPGRSGFLPALRLGYDSGSGNGPFGFGWSLGLPAITRKTDKGLPRYCDGDESDVFILAGAGRPGARARPGRRPEDAAPHGLRDAYPDHFLSAAHRRPVRPHRALDRRRDTGISHWRTISRDNVTTLYGADPASRIADPADPARIFSWQICRSWDDKGNVAIYSYAAEDGAGIDTARRARGEPDRADPRGADLPEDGPLRELAALLPRLDGRRRRPRCPPTGCSRVVLDYGDHASTPPTPQPDQPWPLRPDPFSTYRAGFEVRTYRRVQRLLFFNNFPDEPTAGPDCLVRSLDLRLLRPAGARRPAQPDLHVPRLGRPRPATGRTATAWSPGPCRRWSSSYSQPRDPAGGADAWTRTAWPTCPKGIDGGASAGSTWTARACPGSSAEASGGWYYKRNLSADNLVAQPDGTLGRPRPLRAAGDRGRAAVPLRPVRGRSCSTCPAAAASTWSTWPAPTRASSSARRTGRFEPLQRFRRCRSSTGRTRTSGSSTSPATG